MPATASSNRTAKPARKAMNPQARDNTLSRSAAPSLRTKLVLSLSLAALTIGVYSRVGTHRFLTYDDQDYVTQNTHVQQGLTWDTLSWAVTSTDASNWHPVTWLSHALDYELFDLDPAGHHWTSLIIHALNAVLLFLLLQAVTGATWRSLLVAVGFAVHPLNVESVAWIAERKNVLSTLFFLLALGGYGWYSKKPNPGRYLVMTVLFILALAAKPMAVTFPFVLLLLDFWPLKRMEGLTEPSSVFPARQSPISRLLIEKLPLMLLSVGSAIMTIVAQKESIVPGHSLPFGVRLETSFYAYGVYIWKMIWPTHLALIYPHPGRTLSFWKPLLAGILILVCSIGAWTQRGRRPYLLTGWFWFLGTAVPIIGILQVGVQVVADRYAYLPLIGLFVALAWGLSMAADRLSISAIPRWVVASIVVACLSIATWKQVSTWKDDFTVWNHAVAVTKDNSIAENFLATALFDLGRYPEGMAHLKTYASLEPLDPIAHAKVAADLEDHGRPLEAAKEYETAIHASAVLQRNGLPGMDPRALAITYVNLGRVYGDLGDDAKSAEETQRGLGIDTDAVTEMLREFAQNLATHPTAAGYFRLAKLLNQVGDVGEARVALTRAQQLESSGAPGQNVAPGR